MGRKKQDALTFASGEEMRKAGAQVGKCGCALTRVEGGLHMVECPLHANAQKLLESLKGMIERFEEKSGERPHVFCGCTYCHAVRNVAEAEGRPLPEFLTDDPHARYRVTRWCCSSGDCIKCHETRDRGEAPPSPFSAARQRVMQCDGFRRDQAQKVYDGWNHYSYEPRLE